MKPSKKDLYGSINSTVVRKARWREKGQHIQSARGLISNTSPVNVTKHAIRVKRIFCKKLVPALKRVLGVPQRWQLEEGGRLTKRHCSSKPEPWGARFLMSVALASAGGVKNLGKKKGLRRHPCRRDFAVGRDGGKMQKLMQEKIGKCGSYKEIMRAF